MQSALRCRDRHDSAAAAGGPNEGLKRLKMAAMRRLAPELLVTAKTQRWKPEEFLRTLVEAEIASRDDSNVRTRMKQAAFPVAKRLEEFDVAASSIAAATFAYLASLEWVRAAENVCLIGPAGTGRSHTLIALAIAAVEARALSQVLYRRRSGRDPLPRLGRQLGAARSSTPCCATTSSWSMSSASHPWTTPAPS